MSDPRNTSIIEEMLAEFEEEARKCPVLTERLKLRSSMADLAILAKARANELELNLKIARERSKAEREISNAERERSNAERERSKAELEKRKAMQIQLKILEQQNKLDERQASKKALKRKKLCSTEAGKILISFCTLC